MIYVWTLIVHLYPVAPPHANFGPYYVAGVAFGILMHRWTRRKKRSQVQAKGRLSNLEQALSGEAGGLAAKEREALDLLMVRRRRAELFARMHAWEEEAPLTANLRLIRCSALRMSGEYHASNADTEIAGEEIKPETRTARGEGCPAVLATMALRRAERGLGTPARFKDQQPDRAALDLVNKALERRAASREKTSVQKGALEFGIPFTSSFMKDAIGTALLAAGFLGEAKLYFNSCIHEDPDYSGVYVHLGDYFLLAWESARVSPETGLTPQWHARICYNTALFLERNRHSRIRRRARRRLDWLDWLDRNFSRT